MVDQNVSEFSSSATQQITLLPQQAYHTTYSVYIYARAKPIASFTRLRRFSFSHFDLSLFDDEDACEGGDGDKAEGDVQGCG